MLVRTRSSRQCSNAALRLICFVSALVMILSVTSASAADGPKAYGKTYGEWSTAWWTWVLSIPKATNPLLSTGDVDCAIGQGPSDGSGSPVFFLAGTAGGTADRTCAIPVGKALFFPIVNVFFFNGPDEHFSEAEKRGILLPYLDQGCELSSEIDGEPTLFSDLTPTVRTQSPTFLLETIPDDVFGFPGIVDEQAVSDGFWVMLPPLSSGAHLLHFHGALCDPGTHVPFFSVDVTYHLNVRSGRD